MRSKDMPVWEQAAKALLWAIYERAGLAYSLFLPCYICMGLASTVEWMLAGAE